MSTLGTFFISVKGSIISKEYNYSSYTLIVPAISIGNVGQLAVDLLINTLSMEKIGYFNDSSLCQVVGNDPYQVYDSAKCSLTTAAEVFESARSKVVVVQLRAPCVAGRRKQFLERLADWIQQLRFRETVMLSSSAATERVDSQLLGEQFRFVLSTDVDVAVQEHLTRKLGWRMLERRALFPSPPVLGPTSAPVPRPTTRRNADLYLPGAAFCKQFFRICCQCRISLAVLMVFCEEGDNIEDAVALTNYFNDWKDIYPVKHSQGWRPPPSWRLMFGNAPDKLIFW